MAEPMFSDAGIYDGSVDAELGYEAIKALHGRGAIRSCDSAIIVHRPGGEVKVTKAGKPAHHAAWVGRPRRGRRAPVPAPSRRARRHGGRWRRSRRLFGDLAHGTSRGEAKEIGAMLDPGATPLVVIDIDNDAKAIERAAEHAKAHTFKREFGDCDEAERDALDSILRAAHQAVV